MDLQRDEVAQVDELIGECLRSCARGQTRRGKRNPAFANLESLVRVRRRIVEGKALPEEKGTVGARALAEADALFDIEKVEPS